MHCVPYYNKTVAEVQAMLKERGITTDAAEVHRQA